MEKTKITRYADLMIHIAYLNSEKLKQEEELKSICGELVNSMHPVSIVKQSLHDLAEDKRVHFDLLKAGLNVGSTFLIDNIMGRNKSIRGFLSSMVIEKIASTFINNQNSSKIIAGASKLLQRIK